MRSFVSVQDYGAVGNGVADDTAAIQAAFTANPGKTILFPTGVYVITATLSAPANTTISGYGATLSCTTSQFTALNFVNGGACFGLTITGPASGVYNVNGIGIRCSGVNNAPAAPTFVNAPTIADCTIMNFGFYGVFFAYVNGGVVRNCKITGIGYAAVGGVSCNDTVVAYNYIASVGPGPGNADAYGVFIDRNNGTSETSDPRSQRCTISNNSINSVLGTGGVNGQGIDTHAGVDFTIADNVVSGCQVGIGIVPSVISGTQQLGPKRITVVGNVINGLSVNYGIIVSGAFNGTTVVEYAEQIEIANNVITNHGASNDAINGAIFLQGARGCSVVGNNIRRPLVTGINLNLEVVSVNISGNIIVDPHDSVLTGPACVRVYGNNVTGYIGNNSFIFENAAVNTYVAVESVRVHIGLTGLDIDFGKSTFVGVSATRLTFLPLTTTGVRYAGLASESGSGAITVSSGVGDGIADVTFSKRFPYTPTISVTLRRPFNQGGKFPILGVDTAVAPTAIGFRIYALPYDGATWSASGSLSFDWTAE